MPMRPLARMLSPLLLVLFLEAGLWVVPAEAASKIAVVTTTTDLKALVEAVGGDLVEVDALARGTQNPHDLEVRPSLMVKVRRADLLVMNGLELDQWAEVVVQGAGNVGVGLAVEPVDHRSDRVEVGQQLVERVLHRDRVW